MELRTRIATAERELEESVEEIGSVIEDALDWKKAVRAHPVESAALAAAVGFFVLAKPKAIPRLIQAVGTGGLLSFAGAEGGSLLSGLLARFTSNR